MPIQSGTTSGSAPSLGELIAAAGATLTPTERRLAETVLNDPTAVAFGTVADLAKRAATSGPSVVRFATKLGFDGYGGLQERVRSTLAEQLRRPTDRIRLSPRSDPGESAPAGDRLARLRETMVSRIEATTAALTADELGRLAAPIANAPGDVLILCADTSSAPGRLLSTNLRLLRSGVRNIGGPKSSVAAEIANAGPDDVAIVIDFPRYESTVIEGARALARSRTPIVAITDGPFSPLATMARVWWGIDIGTVGPFDSVLPAIAVAELLIAEVARLLRAEAANRLDHIEQLWDEASVFSDQEDDEERENR